MGLDVEAPDPPDLTNRPLPSEIDPTDVVDGTEDLRREELERMLADGAWNEAFGEWCEYTDLTDSEYRLLRDAGLFERLDFYWDPIDGGVQYSVPHPFERALRDDDLTARAASELADLGRTVVRTLEDAYLDWDEEDIETNAWGEEPFSDDTTSER